MFKEVAFMLVILNYREAQRIRDCIGELDMEFLLHIPFPQVDRLHQCWAGKVMHHGKAAR